MADKKILEEMLMTVLTSHPNININIGSSTSFLCEDLALLLSDIYFQLDILKVKYDIKDNDLRDIGVILNNGTKIPSRLLEYIERN